MLLPLMMAAPVPKAPSNKTDIIITAVVAGVAGGVALTWIAVNHRLQKMKFATTVSGVQQAAKYCKQHGLILQKDPDNPASKEAETDKFLEDVATAKAKLDAADTTNKTDDDGKKDKGGNTQEEQGTDGVTPKTEQSDTHGQTGDGEADGNQSTTPSTKEHEQTNEEKAAAKQAAIKAEANQRIAEQKAKAQADKAAAEHEKNVQDEMKNQKKNQKKTAKKDAKNARVAKAKAKQANLDNESERLTNAPSITDDEHDPSNQNTKDAKTGPRGLGGKTFEEAPRGPIVE